MLYFGDISLNLSEVKSLDPMLPTEEVEILRAISCNFRTGWLYDNIIDTFCSITLDSKSLVFKCYHIQYVLMGNSVVNIWSEVQLNTVELILIPINAGGHWILITAKVKKRNLEFYDPRGVTNIHSDTNCKPILGIWGKKLKNLFKVTDDWLMSSLPQVSQNDSIGPLRLGFI
ncbi:hypothetical protein X975_15640, partial [Stegodyphus mimosarum]